MSRIQGKTSSPQLTTTQVYVGIDVSKSYLDVYVHPSGVARRVTNDKTGLTSLVKFLRPYAPETVVMEATGRYHRLCHRHLHDTGFRVAVMNPYRTRCHYTHLCGLSEFHLSVNLKIHQKGRSYASVYHIWNSNLGLAIACLLVGLRHSGQS